MKSLFLILISVVAATASEHFTLVSKAAAGASDSSAITLSAGDTAALTFASFLPTASRTPATSRLIVSVVAGPAILKAFSVQEKFSLRVGPTITDVEISKVSLPIKLRVGYDGDGPKTPEFATLVVDRAGTASNAAAIPQGVGNFWTVLLEGSSDLVNWTSVPAGDYAGDTPTRFFRTRIIQR